MLEWVAICNIYKDGIGSVYNINLRIIWTYYHTNSYFISKFMDFSIDNRPKKLILDLIATQIIIISVNFEDRKRQRRMLQCVCSSDIRFVTQTKVQFQYKWWYGDPWLQFGHFSHKILPLFRIQRKMGNYFQLNEIESLQNRLRFLPRSKQKTNKIYIYHLSMQDRVFHTPIFFLLFMWKQFYGLLWIKCQRGSFCCEIIRNNNVKKAKKAYTRYIFIAWHVFEYDDIFKFCGACFS